MSGTAEAESRRAADLDTVLMSYLPSDGRSRYFSVLQQITNISPNNWATQKLFDSFVSQNN